MCAGGKAPLLLKLAPEAGPQAELREQRNAEGQGGGGQGGGHAGSKLEGKAWLFCRILLGAPSHLPLLSSPAAMTGKEPQVPVLGGKLSLSPVPPTAPRHIGFAFLLFFLLKNICHHVTWFSVPICSSFKAAVSLLLIGVAFSTARVGVFVPPDAACFQDVPSR